MFFIKGMKALKNAATKLLYEESKDCTKEFMILWFVLKLLMLKAWFGLPDASFNELVQAYLLQKEKECQLTYTCKEVNQSIDNGFPKALQENPLLDKFTNKDN